jgi:hypothetical protein
MGILILTIVHILIEDLELLLCGLSVYKLVTIDGIGIDDALCRYTNHKFKIEDIQDAYLQIVRVMSDYSFGEM